MADVKPYRDVTCAGSLRDLPSIDHARFGHEAIGCWRYPHTGPCKVGVKKRKTKRIAK
jgi:hypothetical protein